MVGYTLISSNKKVSAGEGIQKWALLAFFYYVVFGCWIYSTHTRYSNFRTPPPIELEDVELTLSLPSPQDSKIESFNSGLPPRGFDQASN
jgi:hypothetical protein